MQRNAMQWVSRKQAKGLYFRCILKIKIHKWYDKSDSKWEFLNHIFFRHSHSHWNQSHSHSHVFYSHSHGIPLGIPFSQGIPFPCTPLFQTHDPTQPTKNKNSRPTTNPTQLMDQPNPWTTLIYSVCSIASDVTLIIMTFIVLLSISIVTAMKLQTVHRPQSMRLLYSPWLTWATEEQHWHEYTGARWV